MITNCGCVNAVEERAELHYTAVLSVSVATAPSLRCPSDGLFGLIDGIIMLCMGSANPDVRGVVETFVIVKRPGLTSLREGN